MDYWELPHCGGEVSTIGLGKHASDCAKCGSCEANCPFPVAIRVRLAIAAIFFGQ